MRIDLLASSNPYGTNLHFARSLHAALKEKIDSRFFFVDDEYFFKVLFEIAEDPPDFTLSFSDIHLGGLPVAELFQVPHITWLLDPAIYFLHHLKSPKSLFGCVDQNDVHFLKSLLGQGGDSRVFFLPHGADSKLIFPVESERPYERVFFGTCLDIEAIERSWKNKYQKNEREILHAASDHVLSCKKTSCLQALVALGVEEELLGCYHFEIDRFTRGKDRIELLKNISVDIWGSGPWQKYCPLAKVHPSIDFDKTLQIMQQSKIVFNSGSRFKQGAHERIFYAFLSGACPVSLQTDYLKKLFSEEEIMSYSLGDWQIIGDPESWKQRALLGQEKTMKEHSFEKRAQQLLYHLQKITS